MNKVIIVDDHMVVRRGLKQVFDDEPDFEVVGEASSAREALELIAGAECDVVLLDINLPDQSGLHVLEEVKKRRPELPVLILSIHPEDQSAVRAMKLGAAGYLTKETDQGDLLSAVRRVCSGKRYITQSLAEQLVEELTSSATSFPHEKLSKRELQFLKRMASGMSLRQIAEDLSLSARTVSTYRTRLLAKMEMKSNADLVRYAVKHGLVEP